MAQPGRDASTPWGDSSTNGNEGASSSPEAPSSPPQPIILGGAEGFSVNTQMQGQMPSQLAPASGTTLTGQVGTIDSSVWAEQDPSQAKGSIMKGIGLTCVFGIFMMLVPMLLAGWADNSWDDDWHNEPISVDWDSSGLNGTFQLASAPIEECSLSLFLQGGNRWNEDDFRIEADCDGSLKSYNNELRATFQMDSLNENNTNGTLTYKPSAYDKAGHSISLSLTAYDWQTRTEVNINLGTQIIDENMNELNFSTNVSEWINCDMRLVINSNHGWSELYPRSQSWGEPPYCPTLDYSEYVETAVGSVDQQSGFGELYLLEPLPEGKTLEVDYWEAGEGSFMRDIAPCFGFLFSFVLFIVWIVQIVQSFQGGLSNKGTGMLIGIVPAFFLSMISMFFIGFLFFGF